MRAEGRVVVDMIILIHILVIVHTVVSCPASCVRPPSLASSSSISSSRVSPPSLILFTVDAMCHTFTQNYETILKLIVAQYCDTSSQGRSIFIVGSDVLVQRESSEADVKTHWRVLHMLCFTVRVAQSQIIGTSGFSDLIPNDSLQIDTRAMHAHRTDPNWLHPPALRHVSCPTCPPSPTPRFVRTTKAQAKPR
jgi:hypothetical protein